MIEAHRKSIWAGGYDLVLDDQSLASFNTSTWRTGGSFVVEGRPYEVRSNLWASTHSLVADDGSVVVDFNLAYNPPCVFTPFATCPLPPERNNLPVRVEAGEKLWRQEH